MEVLLKGNKILNKENFYLDVPVKSKINILNDHSVYYPKNELDNGGDNPVIKPDKQTKPPTGRRRTKRHITESLEYVRNQCKWKAASEYCKDNGYEFQIWTEHTLKQMGMKV
mgnify:CR=1 FL=1